MGSHGRGLSSADPLKKWAGRFVRQAAGEGDHVGAMALVDFVIGQANDQLVSAGPTREERAGSATLVDGEEPPGGWTNPWLPGLVHEQAVSLSVRRERGAWYTPPDLVRGLVSLVDEVIDMPLFAVDPTCGGGAFLLALLDHWVGQGVEPGEALQRIAGFDIDPDAVAVCRASLKLWAAVHEVVVEPDALAATVSVADALTVEFPRHWPDRRLVIGNPPFATPLKTAKRGVIPPSAEAYRSAWRDDLGQYADLAAMHFHRAVTTAAAGSPVMLIMPQSVLSSRDVAGLRNRIAAHSATVAMWAAREAVFDAGVRACAPVVVVGEPQPVDVTLATGPRAEISSGRAPQAAEGDPTKSWAALAARSLGAPSLPTSVVRPAGVLSSLCTATAGFRDEY